MHFGELILTQSNITSNIITRGRVVLTVMADEVGKGWNP